MHMELRKLNSSAKIKFESMEKDDGSFSRSYTLKDHIHPSWVLKVSHDTDGSPAITVSFEDTLDKNRTEAIAYMGSDDLRKIADLLNNIANDVDRLFPKEK